MPLAKLLDANCAKGSHPSRGVKRFTLSQLLAGTACGIDHSEPHRLHFHVAVLITEGNCGHMADFSPVPLKSGDLLLLRAGQVHAFAGERTIEGEILTFTPEFLTTLADMPSIADTVETLFDAGPRVSLTDSSACSARGWLSEFSSELALRGQPYSEPRLIHSFGLLLLRLAALPEFALLLDEPESRKPRIVRDFAALLDNNFRSRRDPAWYASQLNVSTRTLDRQLVASLKNTCKELITGRLVLEAKRLLTDPDLQVKGVAHFLQFGEVANFSRFFHHNAGLSPSDFRTHVPGWPI